MGTIKGIDAIRRAELLCKTGGDFSLVFFPYSRTKQVAEHVELKTYERCTTRRPLPHDKFDIDGKNFFLFLTEDQKPRSCYRALIRFIGFSDDNYKLKKIIWYE